MEIRLLTPEIKEKWDSFVINTEGRTCYHLSNWKAVFEQTYRYQTYYLYAIETNNANESDDFNRQFNNEVQHLG